MVVSFEDINDKFDRVFGFIRRDLERILELEVEGNLAIALLITCACETLENFVTGAAKALRSLETFGQAVPTGCGKATLQRSQERSRSPSRCPGDSIRWTNLADRYCVERRQTSFTTKD